ncbi:hypothetical protein [Rhizobium sp. MHM7A]|uniref:hypothetical protein n=1 Tax=Rhizobium sp. MHM7A TaxID=2583233 RepID=UPI0011060119|nr:hypothetical protein [Rhizobium sp. MHM7A]TLX16283.1 hypothetical protein FFR93_02845 [Rhizobium sp. MHM7A]
MANLKTYSDEAIEAAQKGPHRTWDTYDMQNEGVRIHTLHNLVSADVFDPEEAKAVLTELEQLSRSYGYGTCDSLLCEMDNKTRADLEEDTVMQIRFDGLFYNEDEDSYFHDANTSEKKLWEAAKTNESRNFLKGDHISYNGYNGALSSTMLAAFRHGRDMRALEAGREDLVSENSPAKLTP